MENKTESWRLMNKAGQFKQLFLGLLLTGLFLIAMISFAVQLGLDNNSKISILNRSEVRVAFDAINKTLSTTETDVEVQYNLTTSEDPKDEGGQLTIKSITKAIPSLTQIPFAILTVMLSLIGLYVDIVVIVVIAGIFTGIFLFAFWRLIRTGS